MGEGMVARLLEDASQSFWKLVISTPGGGGRETVTALVCYSAMMPTADRHVASAEVEVARVRDT